jgi:hypothetical protein
MLITHPHLWTARALRQLRKVHVATRVPSSVAATRRAVTVRCARSGLALRHCDPDRYCHLDRSPRVRSDESRRAQPRGAGDTPGHRGQQWEGHRPHRAFPPAPRAQPNRSSGWLLGLRRGHELRLRPWVRWRVRTLWRRWRWRIVRRRGRTDDGEAKRTSVDGREGPYRAPRTGHDPRLPLTDLRSCRDSPSHARG